MLSCPTGFLQSTPKWLLLKIDNHILRKDIVSLPQKRKAISAQIFQRNERGERLPFN